MSSLKPFLNKPHKKVEALVIPFLLFCHNGFIGDFVTRMNKLENIIDMVQHDEFKVAKHLTTVLNFYDHFLDQVREKKKKATKELKTKFEVQIKANKRIYEEANIDNHFKAANSIVKESTSKLEDLSLSYARNNFKSIISSDLKFDLMDFHGKIKEIKIDESYVSHLKKCVFVNKINKSVEEINIQNWEIVSCWKDDVDNLVEELSKTAPKKLTFHIVKTKAQTGFMLHLKDMGLTKYLGAKLDIQLFKVLQFVSGMYNFFPNYYSDINLKTTLCSTSIRTLIVL